MHLIRRSKSDQFGKMVTDISRISDFFKFAEKNDVIIVETFFHRTTDFKGERHIWRKGTRNAGSTSIALKALSHVTESLPSGVKRSFLHSDAPLALLFPASTLQALRVVLAVHSPCPPKSIRTSCLKGILDSPVGNWPLKLLALAGRLEVTVFKTHPWTALCLDNFDLFISPVLNHRMICLLIKLSEYFKEDACPKQTIAAFVFHLFLYLKNRAAINVLYGHFSSGYATSIVKHLRLSIKPQGSMPVLEFKTLSSDDGIRAFMTEKVFPLLLTMTKELLLELGLHPWSKEMSLDILHIPMYAAQHMGLDTKTPESLSDALKLVEKGGETWETSLSAEFGRNLAKLWRDTCISRGKSNPSQDLVSSLFQQYEE
eukprot:gnl/Dysnectes_brevis/5313_a7580_414.p1 GENE.gnl/Dysnectes_brevis/5313_a7580_414~~gnl/Dysnectes_brevis/5313_a7580_414.p1  ORF type:complete len:372 (-),score=18.07 gnl/Dysnectes_brevis/5313_a7580_414:78-1193(-)